MGLRLYLSTPKLHQKVISVATVGKGEKYTKTSGSAWSQEPQVSSLSSSIPTVAVTKTLSFSEASFCHLANGNQGPACHTGLETEACVCG